MANNNRALSLTPEVQEAFQPAVLEVIRTSLCPTASDAEFVLFAHKAATYGLDPFKNEIFFIKYGNQARIQFAAEAYLAKARQKDGFQAPDTQMVCTNDEFKIAKNPETKELEVALHEIGFPRGEIVGAYSIAYRDGHRPVTVIMDRSEIQHMFSGQNKDNWTKWTTDMFGKHVEQRALKKQYGLEFGDDDIPQAVDQVDPYQRKDVTPTPEQHPDDTDEPAKSVKAEITEPTPIEKARAEMKEKFKILGIIEPEAMQAYIAKHAAPKGVKPTLAELKGLLKIMDGHIADQQAEREANDELPM